MLSQEIFKTSNASIVQCDRTENFLLSYHHLAIPLKFCELIKLRNKLRKVNIVDMLASESPDTEVFYLPMSERFLVLNVMEILELKDLFSGTFAMLELNSLLHSCLKRNTY